MIKINNNYLRNTNEYPLCYSNRSITGIIINPQPGKCNHFSMRYDNGKPIYIVQHYTAVSFNKTMEIFTDQAVDQNPVSTHYVIDTDGAIYQLVDPQYKAYHAGVGNISMQCKWYHRDLPITGINDMNNWSIGIENVNLGTKKFTDAQKKSNILLCEFLCNEYNIDPQFIIGHADWSPGRKIDPGPYFFGDEMSKARDLHHEDVTRNFGIYPQQNNLTLTNEPDIVLSYDCSNTNTIQVTEIQNKLKNLYSIDDEEGTFGPNTRNALLSFRIHFSGGDIIESPYQRQAWDDLCSDNDITNNQNLLGICTENDLERLDNILNQIKGECL